MRRILSGLVIVMVLTACSSGSSGPAGDPVAAVNNVVNAMKAKNFKGIPPMICAAKRDQVASTIDPAAVLASGAPGVTEDMVLGAMNVDVQNYSATKVSETATAAVVDVKGSFVITLDDGKARELVKAVLAGQGKPTDDASVATSLAFFKSFVEGSNDMSGQLDVVKEADAWLVCDDLSFNN